MAHSRTFLSSVASPRQLRGRSFAPDYLPQELSFPVSLPLLSTSHNGPALDSRIAKPDHDYPLRMKHKIMGYLKNVLRPALGWPSFKEKRLKLHEPGF